LSAPAAHPVESAPLVRDVPSLLEALNRRREELGLSTAYVESVADLPDGFCSKVLGPGRAKTPSLPTLDVLMQVLAVSFQIVPDSDKQAKMSALWERRQAHQVRATMVGPLQIKRARPFVLRELASRAGRWANTTPDERRAAMQKVQEARGKNRRKRA